MPTECSLKEQQPAVRPCGPLAQSLRWFFGEDWAKTPYKVVGTVLGAGFALFLFAADVRFKELDRDRFYDLARKQAALDFSKRALDNSIISNAIALVSTAFESTCAKELLAKPGPESDLPAVFRSLIEGKCDNSSSSPKWSSQDLEAAVWRLREFYNGVAQCAESKVCDSHDVCAFFARDLYDFTVGTGSYYSKVQATQYGTDYLANIKAATCGVCRDTLVEMNLPNLSLPCKS